MWTLVILAFWWMQQSSDAATSTTVPGFSSKATCIRAGEQFIRDAGYKITLTRSGSNSLERSVFFNYQCVEVK